MSVEASGVRVGLAALAAAFMGIAAGCGGGESGFSVSLDRQEVTIEGDEGGGAYATVTATVHGTPSGTLYVAVTTGDAGIGSYDLSFSETSASVTLYADPALAAGTYAGHVQVWTCADEACTRPVGGAPFTVAYTVVLHRSLRLTPDQLELAGVMGQAATGEVAVQLPDGATDYTLSVSADSAWLTTTRTAQGFTVSANHTPGGRYWGSVLVAAGAKHATLQVTYDSSPPPGGAVGFEVSPSYLTLAATEGGTSAVQALTAQLPSWYPDGGWASSVDPAAAWLVVTPTATGFDVYADAANLAEGTYQSAITVTVPGDPYSYGVSVPVALTVGTGLVRPADRTITVTSATTLDGLSGTAAVDMVSGPARGWTAQSDSAWLVLDTASGQTGQAVAYHVDAATVAAMAAGASRTAVVTVQATPATISPTQFAVTLERRLAEVRYVGPSVQLAGRAGRVIVRGRDFGADAAGELAVSGLAGATATRVNDTELRVDLPAAAVGRCTFSIPNALGLATSSASLDVIAPATLEYQAFASGGAKHGLTWDPVAQVLFAVDQSDGTILQYRRAGGTWSAAAQAVPSLSDAALTPDRTALLAASKDGVVRVLDPGTLEVQGSYARGGNLASYGLGNRMVVTNDGLAWLSFGDDYWHDLGTFDLTTGAFAPADVSQAGQTLMYEGPWFSVSGDGERVVMVQAAGVSPMPPLLWLDAADGLARTAPPTDPAWFWYASQSEDGSRIALDANAVYDAGFARIGALTLPVNHWAHGAAISPDGQRAYVLEANGTQPTRFWVFDVSQAAAGGGDLPIVGSFDVADDPTCADAGACDYSPEVIIAPDGQTLFVAGYGKVLVVPVPATLQPWPAAAPAAQAVRPTRVKLTADTGGGRARAWRIDAAR